MPVCRLRPKTTGCACRQTTRSHNGSVYGWAIAFRIVPEAVKALLSAPIEEISAAIVELLERNCMGRQSLEISRDVHDLGCQPSIAR